MNKQLEQEETGQVNPDQPAPQEDLTEEFFPETIMASMHQGTQHEPIVAWLHKDTGLGYRELADGTYALLLKEEGYLLCRYVLPTYWQAEEACRRLASLVDFQVPANQLFSNYAQTHSEKLGAVIKRVFSEVMEGSSPQPTTYRSIEEHLEALKDFVLERGDPDAPMPPIILL
jgi:hypothetical protein